MIVSTERLAEFLKSVQPVAGPAICAIDTEADSLHRYRESLCLIQFAVRGESVLIDPLAIQDLSPLGDYLTHAIVWMHGADYDMTMFKRQFGTLPPIVYDTQIGARLLGARRFGLGDLVSQYFGVDLVKSSQKADWGKRPLSPKMIDYALNDVNYLLEMGDMIVAGLKEKGRYTWFEESCTATRQKVLDRDDSSEENWKIQGSGKLPPYGLACLKTLWYWRDSEAKTWDRPSFMVCPNKQLLDWTIALSENKDITLPHHYRPDRVKRFKAAVETAKNMPEDQWPKRPNGKRRKRDKDFEKRVDSLIKTRETCATQLDIEGSLIASRSALESIAAGDFKPSEILLAWQRQCLELGD